MKKTICLFNSNKDWGGGEKWHLEIATKLAEKEYDIWLVTNKKSALFNKSKSKNVKKKSVKITNISFLNIFKIIGLIYFFKKEKISTIILNLPADLKSAGIAAKLAGVKNVIYRRGSAIPIKNTVINRFLFKRIIDRVIANSEETKNTIFQNNENFIAKDKVTVIYNGLDKNNYKIAKSSLNFKTKNEVILGNIGRLTTQKGQKYLIDIAEILKTKNINFKIVIAGDGDLKEELQQYAESKKVSDKVEFCGFIEDIPNFINAIDVSLLTSLWEGFGYVLIEAMVMEKPVIAFDVSNINEIIDHEKNGYLIKFPDVNDFADKIALLIKDKEKMDSMGKDGRRKVEEKFIIKKTIEEVEKLLI